MIAILTLAAFAAQETLDEEIRAAQARIEEARGLTFREPVRVHRIPRPAEADESLQGFYSPVERALVVYENVRGNYRAGVLLHELVHALQDQRFDLRGEALHAQPDTDRGRARAALVEGDAVLTMIEALGEAGDRVRPMLTPDWSRRPERVLAYSAGARFVAALRERGGWEEVNRAYEDPPRTTEEILHPDRYVRGVSGRDAALEAGVEPRGEFGVLSWLLGRGVAPETAVTAADGWDGDADAGRGWRIHWATDAEAEEFWRAAAPTFREGAIVEEEDAVVREHGEKVEAVLRVAAETWWFEADDLDELGEMLDEGPPRTDLGAWEILDGATREPVEPGEFFGRLAEARVVAVGEDHDSVLHHDAQLAVIRAVDGLGGRTGVGMEMFERRFQSALDDYALGRIDEAEMLARTEYADRWRFDFEKFYQGIVEYGRAGGVPIAALNAPRELVQKVSREGWDKLTAAERRALGDVDFDVDEHRDHWHGQFAEMHGQAPDPEVEERMYQAMCVWDDYMAASAAEFVERRRLDRIVIVAGGGHTDFGFGIPDRAARRLGGASPVIVHVSESMDAAQVEDDGIADFILVPR